MGSPIGHIDARGTLFLPLRWALYCLNLPALWTIFGHMSTYSVPRKLYVLWLNWVMLIGGAIATLPHLAWGHKAYWMAVSCAPFPEIMYHLWRMITDTIDFVPSAPQARCRRPLPAPTSCRRPS